MPEAHKLGITSNGHAGRSQTGSDKTTGCGSQLAAAHTATVGCISTAHLPCRHGDCLSRVVAQCLSPGHSLRDQQQRTHTDWQLPAEATPCFKYVSGVLSTAIKFMHNSAYNSNKSRQPLSC